METADSAISVPEITYKPLGFLERAKAEITSFLRHRARGDIVFQMNGIYYQPGQGVQYRPDNEFDEAIKKMKPAWFVLRHMDLQLSRRQKRREVFRDGKQAHAVFTDLLKHYIAGVDLNKHPIGAQRTDWRCSNGIIRRVDFYLETTPIREKYGVWPEEWTSFSFSDTRGFKTRFPRHKLAEVVRADLKERGFSLATS